VGIALYTADVLASGPAAFWPCGQYNVVPDISGNNLPMTTVTITEDQFGKAGPYPGFQAVRGTGGSGASRAAVTTVVDNFTIELWFNGELFLADNQSMFGNQDGGTAGWGFLIKSSRRLVGIAQGVGFLTTGPTVLTAGVWYHLVMTRRSTVWMYFINGQVELANAGTTTPVGTAVSSIIHTAASLQALYSNVALYTRSLTNGEILSHYLSAVRPDNSALASNLQVMTVA
jgi:hypothetical protein